MSKSEDRSGRVMSLPVMKHTKPQLLLMAAVAILVAIAVLAAHIARAAVPETSPGVWTSPNISIMTIRPAGVFHFASQGKMMARVDADGTVAIDWLEVDRVAAEGPPWKKDRAAAGFSQNLYVYARMLIAARDGTWEVLDQ